MSWSEFCTLLSGIMSDTPLGKVVETRAEEDKEILKNFTSEQHRIRNEWRSRQLNKQLENMTEEDKEKQVKEIQELFAKAFS